MRWWLHDADATVEIATEATASEADARALSDRELEALLGRAGSDLWTMSTLRNIYVDALARGGSASVSDLVVLGELIEAVHGGRLRAWASQHVRPRTQAKPTVRTADAVPDLVDLATIRVPPPEPVILPPSPAVLHQAAILQRAAESGAPFCEECECVEE